MPTWTYVKKSGAPSGSIHISVGNDSFLIDDSSNSSVAVTSEFQAGELSQSPYLTLSGVSNVFTPPPLIQNVSLVNGVLSTIGANGIYIPIGTTGGPLLPSGGDDTAAINNAVSIGQQLGPGTFKISGIINGWPLGQSPQLTILQATASAARIVAGAENGQGPVQNLGLGGNFCIDGRDIAGGSAPLVTANTVGTTILPLQVINGRGDGLVVCGQNCTFMTPMSGNHRNCSFVLDNTCGGNTFVNFEFTSAVEYHMEFRQSTPPIASGYTVPTENKFYSGRTEYGFTNDGQNVNTGPNAGSLHHLAGSWNRLDHVLFDSPRNVPLVKFEPNPAGRSTDYNGDLVLTGGCGLYGNRDIGITSTSTSLLGDYAFHIEDTFIISGPTVGIDWTCYNKIRFGGMQPLMYGPSTTFYSPHGGSPPLDTGILSSPMSNLAAGVQDLKAYWSTEQASMIVDRDGRGQLRGGLATTSAFAAQTTLCNIPYPIASANNTVLPTQIWGISAPATLVGSTFIQITQGNKLQLATALSAGQAVLLDTAPFVLAGA